MNSFLFLNQPEVLNFDLWKRIGAGSDDNQGSLSLSFPSVGLYGDCFDCDEGLSISVCPKITFQSEDVVLNAGVRYQTNQMPWRLSGMKVSKRLPQHQATSAHMGASIYYDVNSKYSNYVLTAKKPRLWVDLLSKVENYMQYHIIDSKHGFAGINDLIGLDLQPGKRKSISPQQLIHIRQRILQNKDQLKQCIVWVKYQCMLISRLSDDIHAILSLYGMDSYLFIALWKYHYGQINEMLSKLDAFIDDDLQQMPIAAYNVLVNRLFNSAHLLGADVSMKTKMLHDVAQHAEPTESFYDMVLKKMNLEQLSKSPLVELFYQLDMRARAILDESYSAHSMSNIDFLISHELAHLYQIQSWLDDEIDENSARLFHEKLSQSLSAMAHLDELLLKYNHAKKGQVRLEVQANQNDLVFPIQDAIYANVAWMHLLDEKHQLKLQLGWSASKPWAVYDNDDDLLAESIEPYAATSDYLRGSIHYNHEFNRIYPMRLSLSSFGRYQLVTHSWSAAAGAPIWLGAKGVIDSAPFHLDVHHMLSLSTKIYASYGDEKGYGNELGGSLLLSWKQLLGSAIVDANIGGAFISPQGDTYTRLNYIDRREIDEGDGRIRIEETPIYEHPFDRVGGWRLSTQVNYWHLLGHDVYMGCLAEVGIAPYAWGKYMNFGLGLSIDPQLDILNQL